MIKQFHSEARDRFTGTTENYALGNQKTILKQCTQYLKGGWGG